MKTLIAAAPIYTQAIRSALSGTAAVVALSLCIGLSPGAALADHDRRDGDRTALLSGIASALLLGEVLGSGSEAGFGRSRRDRGVESSQRRGYQHGWDRSPRGPRDSARHRRDFGASFSSEPIRGGSSRRTRVIENPYPGRSVIGISFAGIDYDPVHINDVITYPRKRMISRRGYSLSLYHPSAYLDTRGYVDFISVKAKRRQYFTVTFHYQ